jgi:hypothetical protein
MGMIIRVAFNNRDWKGKCTNVKDDKRFFKCSMEVVRTGYKIGKNGNCVSKACWEQHLCKKYRWRNNHGNFKRARAKEPVFFVFPHVDNSLVLWGMSKIKEVKGNEIYFDEFEPLPPEIWVRGLSSKKLIGKHWGSGFFRYIGPDKEAKLKNLIKESKLKWIKSKDETFEDSIETEITDKEGKKILRKHLVRERSSKLVSAFKKSLPSYKCWVCGFDFQETYGKIGEGFIEAHHTIPVSSLDDKEVSIKDFAAVCSNCHRMIHKRNPMLDWKKLKKIVEEQKVKRH